MRIFEIIMGALALVSLVFLYFGIPGGVVLALLSFYSLAIFYYIFSFAFFNDIKLRDVFVADAYKNIGPKRIIGAIALGQAIAMILSGSYTMLMRWMGGELQVSMGLLILLLVFSLVFFKYISPKNIFHKRMFVRMVIYGSFAVLMLITM